MSTPLNFTGLPGWAQILIEATVILAFLTGVAALGRRAWKALGVIVKVGDALPALQELPQYLPALRDLSQFMVTTAHSFADQDVKIERIDHQTHENNGGSLKDATVRIERKVDTQGRKLAQSVRAQKRIEEGVAGLYTRVDANEAAAAKDRSDIAAARQDIENTRPTVRRPAIRSTKPKEET